MLHHELLRDQGILILTPEGRLESADFQRLAAEIDPYLQQQGHLRGLMIDVESFPGWKDFGALVSHLRFVKNHHQRIDRIAAVTDSGFLTILPRVSQHFIHAEVRHFTPAKKRAAMLWLESADR